MNIYNSFLQNYLNKIKRYPQQCTGYLLVHPKTQRHIEFG